MSTSQWVLLCLASVFLGIFITYRLMRKRYWFKKSVEEVLESRDLEWLVDHTERVLQPWSVRDPFLLRIARAHIFSICKTSAECKFVLKNLSLPDSGRDSDIVKDLKRKWQDFSSRDFARPQNFSGLVRACENCGEDHPERSPNLMRLVLLADNSDECMIAARLALRESEVRIEALLKALALEATSHERREMLDKYMRRVPYDSKLWRRFMRTEFNEDRLIEAMKMVPGDSLARRLAKSRLKHLSHVPRQRSPKPEIAIV
ncbi:hypothetical protein KW790_01040 [Candidatus Parcubacteria bacterium]|nr:hypothetical protein [Candidatus Parcubacteria bacterium]